MNSELRCDCVKTPTRYSFDYSYPPHTQVQVPVKVIQKSLDNSCGWSFEQTEPQLSRFMFGFSLRHR